jgi:hypothetical protein
VLAAAVNKLDITDEEAAAHDTARLLRARLTDGGFGLTSAALTSPGVYLSSVAAAHSAIVFAPYTRLRPALCPRTRCCMGGSGKA